MLFKRVKFSTEKLTKQLMLKKEYTRAEHKRIKWK